MHFKFEVGHNAAEATKNIYWVKGAVDCTTVSRRLKKNLPGSQETWQSSKVSLKPLMSRPSSKTLS